MNHIPPCCFFCAMMGTADVPTYAMAKRGNDDQVVGTCKSCYQVLISGDAKPEDFILLSDIGPPDHTLN